MNDTFCLSSKNPVSNIDDFASRMITFGVSIFTLSNDLGSGTSRHGVEVVFDHRVFALSEVEKSFGETRTRIAVIMRIVGEFANNSG